MKNFSQIAKADTKKKPNITKKPKRKYKRAPQAIEQHNHYENISRIFPFFVAENFEIFELLPPQRYLKPEYQEGYLLRIKQKISCMTDELLL